MGFAHAQASALGTTNGSSTSTSAVLTNNPANTDLICVGTFWFNGTNTAPGSHSVADLTPNTYTRSPNSPEGSPNANTTGFSYIYYLNNATSALKTVTASYSDPGASGAVEIIVDDFTVSGGTSAFSSDAIGTATGVTSVTTPTVTASGTGNLFYAFAIPNTSISSVDAPWTQAKLGTDGSATGYILSQGANQALAMTMGSGNYNSNGASFTFTASGGDVLQAQILM